ncbi:Cap3p [Trichosporon asahii var. asahii CBS 8904]|uniref:Cap3p n=1 Tax=Trichosporon asahii var. asahii (strain CBS 8904) TaxID=1220162 RepID=K1VKI3_TRIAC|nr:Cap3p [Trichosporon asahii var. asahii CBS 8904]
MLRSSSFSGNSSSYDEKPLSRRRHSVEEGMLPAQQRRHGLSAMLGVRTRYRIAYAILTACIIYLFVVGIEKQLSPSIPSFESFAGEIPAETERGGTVKARAAHQAAKQAVLGGKRVPLPAEVEGAPAHKVKEGFLRVDPNARVHPIHQLIRDARRKWDTKLAKQSRTLREAVDEYQNRYYQHPPKGFEKWWRYVV